jgi:hypothetical protein
MSKENTESTNTNENVVGSVEKILTMPTLSTPVGAAIGTSQLDPKAKTTKPVVNPIVVKPNINEKVAVFSTGSKFWGEVGRLTNGYNIITKEEAEKWLTDPEVRMASPQEIKDNFPVGDEE